MVLTQTKATGSQKVGGSNNPSSTLGDCNCLRSNHNWELWAQSVNIIGSHVLTLKNTGDKGQIGYYYDLNLTVYLALRSW